MTAEQTLVHDCLERAVAEFQSNPLSRGIMRRFMTDVPAVFGTVARARLLTAEDTPGYKHLAWLLLQLPTLFTQLSNPANFTRDQATTLARRLMLVDSALDIRFARQLPARNGNVKDTLEGAAAERALDILDEISPRNRLVPVLSHLTRHPNQKIASKATLIIGKRVSGVAFAIRLMAEETDPRVRANALEAVWGNDSGPVKELFWKHVDDSYHRVAGNAIVGLYLAGEEKVNAVVSKLALDPRQEFRMMAAWTMGRIGNTDFVPTLTPLLKDQDPAVRRAALRSLQNIRNIERIRRPSEADPNMQIPAKFCPFEPPPFLAASQIEVRLDGGRHAMA